MLIVQVVLLYQLYYSPGWKGIQAASLWYHIFLQCQISLLKDKHACKCSHHS